MFQCRSIDIHDEPKLVPIPFDINLTWNTGLRFCPFCAVPVQETIAKNSGAFTQLADAHKMLTEIHHKKQ
jgi:hypothetical protein